MITGTAIELRPGDLWDWFSQGSVEVEATELTDDGLVKISGKCIGGRDHGVRASWSLPLNDRVEYDRGDPQ